MNNFETIEEYYQYVERDKDLLYDINISKSLESLRDKCADEMSKQYCAFEIYFTDLRISKGEITPHVPYIGERSKGTGYPSFDLFTDDLEYIKQRASVVANPKYKAKYFLVLWGSKHKKIDHARQVIDSYLSFLQSTSFPILKNTLNRAFSNYYRNLFSLSQKIDYRKEEILQFIQTLLGTQKISGWEECELMKFIAEEGRKTTTHLEQFLAYSEKVVNENIYPECFQKYLELQILLSQTLKLSASSYHNKLAGFHLEQARKKENSFAVNIFYLKAINEYRKAGNKEQIEETTVLVEKAKKKLNMKKVAYEYTDELIQHCGDIIKRNTDIVIEKYSYVGIYEYLIHQNIFPTADVLTQRHNPAMLDFMTVMNFDINRNISTGKSGFINPYLLHVQNFSMPHLGMVFRKGIDSGKISYESLVEFLSTHSWYGIEQDISDNEDEVEKFRWLELLTPSLLSFFNQIKIDFKNSSENGQSYILCIDSLVLKFEGLLREFSRNINAQTIEIKEDGTQERISFDKLLDNPKFINAVPAVDIALFKFIFTSEGMNLRNNIAHCFFKTNNYYSSLMLLLIVAILKLGNCKFKSTAT